MSKYQAWCLLIVMGLLLAPLAYGEVGGQVALIALFAVACLVIGVTLVAQGYFQVQAQRRARREPAEPAARPVTAQVVNIENFFAAPGPTSVADLPAQRSLDAHCSEPPWGSR